MSGRWVAIVLEKRKPRGSAGANGRGRSYRSAPSPRYWMLWRAAQTACGEASARNPNAVGATELLVPRAASTLAAAVRAAREAGIPVRAEIDLGLEALDLERLRAELLAQARGGDCDAERVAEVLF